MWANLLQKIAEKQSQAMQQLSQNYSGLNFTEDSSKISDMRTDTNEMESNNKISSQQINMNVDNEKEKQKQVRYDDTKRKKDIVSPINGFRLTQQNSQNQLPTPKLINSAVTNDLYHKPQPSAYDGNSTQKFSIMVNGEANPEEIPQLNSRKKQTNSLLDHKQKQKYTTEKLSKVRLKSINLANLKARKSIKTEVSSFVTGQQNYSDEEREYHGSRRIDDIRHSLVIESNVISYCQSLNQSKINEELLLNQKDNQKRHKKKNSKLTNSRRHRTEEKQKQKELEIFLKNQQQIRSQLRVVYQKKFKLQDKLKKLNRELQKMQAEQTSRVVQNFNKVGNLPQAAAVGHAQILKPRKYYNIDIVQKSASWRHEKQIESSKRAIQFIQKVSKESLKRRISYNKKINKNIFQRVRSHVCVDCSRTKCQIEAFQGEERNQRNT